MVFWFPRPRLPRRYRSAPLQNETGSPRKRTAGFPPLANRFGLLRSQRDQVDALGESSAAGILAGDLEANLLVARAPWGPGGDGRFRIGGRGGIQIYGCADVAQRAADLSDHHLHDTAGWVLLEANLHGVGAGGDVRNA